MHGEITTPVFYVTPLYQGWLKRLVRLLPGLSYPHGTVLGEVRATPNVYGPYDPAATDGRQLAKAVLEADCAVDASGAITVASLVAGQGPLAQQPRDVVYAFTRGAFAAADLVGLDDQAVAQLGRLIQGNVFNGTLLVR